MMHRIPAAIGLLEHREVDNPQWAPALLDQTEVVSNTQTQRAEGIANGFVRIGTEENEITILSTNALV